MTTVNADRLTTSTGFPFVVTRKSKAAKFELAVNRLMAEIAAGEESAEQVGWIDESEILSEFGASVAIFGLQGGEGENNFGDGSRR